MTKPEFASLPSGDTKHVRKAPVARLNPEGHFVLKRIFMVSGQLMFSEGVESMLQDRSVYEIVGRETDVTKAIERITALQPDIIIIDCANLDLLAATTVASIMNQAPNTKIIALNLTDNQIRLYKSEQRTARSSIDLLEALEDDVSEGGAL